MTSLPILSTSTGPRFIDLEVAEKRLLADQGGRSIELPAGKGITLGLGGVSRGKPCRDASDLLIGLDGTLARVAQRERAPAASTTSNDATRGASSSV